MVIGAYAQRERQIGVGTPLFMKVKAETIEATVVPLGRRKSLRDCGEVRFWAGRVDTTKEEGIDSLRSQLRYAIPVESPSAPVSALEAHSQSQFVLAARFHQIIGNLVGNCGGASRLAKDVVQSSKHRELATEPPIQDHWEGCVGL